LSQHKAVHVLLKFGKNRARDTPMQEVYVPKFGKNSVTFSVFWPPHATSAQMGVKFGIREVAFGISVMLLTLVDSITPNFTPIGAAWVEKHQNHHVC